MIGFSPVYVGSLEHASLFCGTNDNEAMTQQTVRNPDWPTRQDRNAHAKRSYQAAQSVRNSMNGTPMAEWQIMAHFPMGHSATPAPAPAHPTNCGNLQ